jgi:HD-GYP domain-containing protein (c-di-GMP phosphodiesterase class II)
MNTPHPASTPLPPPSGYDERTYLTRVIYIVWAVGAVAIIFLGTLYTTSVGWAPSLIFPIALAGIASVVNIFILRRGHLRLAAYILTLNLWAVTVLSTWDSGGLRAMGFGGGIILVVLLSAIVLGQWGAVVFIGLSLIAGVVLAYGEMAGYITPTPANATPLSALIAYIAFIIIAAGLMHVATSSIRNALTRAQQELAERQRVEDALMAEIEQRQLVEEKLEAANGELLDAYNSTLTGWSRALELREQETGDHSRRVVTLTLQLARLCDVPESELEHIRRGALIHDIGKMGVPDDILLKPSDLTQDEWLVMKQHPLHAHKLLSEIAFLGPAMSIPMAHHERWDGHGYPQGLKGEDIPLAARIFSIVDVWDALLSDRPYRPAWTKDRVLAYLQDEAGLRFDPSIVPLFVSLVKNSEAGA